MSNLARKIEAAQEATADLEKYLHPVQALYHRALDAGINFEDIEDIDDWGHDCLAHGFTEYDAEEAEVLAQLIDDMIKMSEQLTAYVEYMRTAEEA